MWSFCLFLAVVHLGRHASASKYGEFNLMPNSRSLAPIAVLDDYTEGNVSGADEVTEGNTGSLSLNGNSSVTFDYKKNIAGLVSIQVESSSGSDQRVGVSFSESALWISGQHSDTTSNIGFDRTVFIDTPTGGNFSLPRELGRGAFRYLTLSHNMTGSIKISAVRTHFTAMPHWNDNDLGSYKGYFHCNDQLLNRIWWAGAYTLNLCTIDPKRGNALVAVLPVDNTVAPNGDWYYNFTVTNGTSALVDGAKRDALVWPGDMVVAVSSILVSTNDMVTVKNSLDSLYQRQNSTSGLFAYAGAPVPLAISSWTYHMETLISSSEYYLATDDTEWLSSVWPKYKLALKFVLDKIDDSGLLYVDPTAGADWLRTGMMGHNIEANAILYHAIGLSVSLAQALNDTSEIAFWRKYAEGIRTAANARLWDGTKYRDNEASTLAPQDGNSWAVVAGLAANTSQATAISNFLSSRWTPYGAPAPENTVNGKVTVSPFISGFEVQAHFLAGNATRGLDLIRREWGFMLDDPRMTNSTFIEGFSSDGSLHYPPYPQDSKISLAHGWSTAPTSILTSRVAGIQLLAASGSSWTMAPSLGDLRTVEAGFETNLGFFSSEVRLTDDGGLSWNFTAPAGTTGSVNVPHPTCSGLLHLHRNNAEVGDIRFEVVAESGSGRFVIEGLSGGSYTLLYSCSDK